MAATKVHVLRNPWEEIQSDGTSWTCCGCFAPIVTHERAEEATCLICRASAGLTKSLRQVELPPSGIIRMLTARIQVFSRGEGWRNVRAYGRTSEQHHWQILDVRPPLHPIPHYAGPDNIWSGTGNCEDIPGGYHVLILQQGALYGALRSRGDLFCSLRAYGLPEPGETASEGPQGASKTWLERVAEG